MARPINDQIRFDIIQRERIAITPKDGGGWWAEIYGDLTSAQWVYEGETARAAVDAAIEAIRERQGA